MTSPLTVLVLQEKGHLSVPYIRLGSDYDECKSLKDFLYHTSTLTAVSVSSSCRRLSRGFTHCCSKCSFFCGGPGVWSHLLRPEPSETSGQQGCFQLIYQWRIQPDGSIYCGDRDPGRKFSMGDNRQTHRLRVDSVWSVVKAID